MYLPVRDNRFSWWLHTGLWPPLSLRRLAGRLTDSDECGWVLPSSFPRSLQGHWASSCVTTLSVWNENKIWNNEILKWLHWTCTVIEYISVKIFAYKTDAYECWILNSLTGRDLSLIDPFMVSAVLLFSKSKWHSLVNCKVTSIVKST